MGHRTSTTEGLIRRTVYHDLEITGLNVARPLIGAAGAQVGIYNAPFDAGFLVQDLAGTAAAAAPTPGRGKVTRRHRRRPPRGHHPELLRRP